MLLSINSENPQPRLIDQVIEVLRGGGVIIYPTDTVYGLGCDINNRKAVHRLCQIKGIDPDKAFLSCMCEDVAIIGSYANHVSTPVYKMMRIAFPGPYTFILEASKQIPKHFQHKKTVGIRVAGDPIPLALTQGLGNPIASISLPQDETHPEYNTDPSLMHERFGKLVDLVIDGGPGKLIPSTIIDASKGENELVVIRQGDGELDKLGVVLDE
jgi:tRNA threonylcarbamoyl adenosine modification protein (Sua5/YciO/YrdC/YwlC family)